jgi:dTDP-4-amino-4,6-dideoxygalactose transaminase
MNPHKVTRAFEDEIAKYTGAPYCVTVDNESNALFLALKCFNVTGLEIVIPNHTYMSVPCEIIHAGGKVLFESQVIHNYIDKPTLTGPYRLYDTNVWDSALRFSANMYIPGSFMCCSFTGAYKHLNLGKGGCILTDDLDAYEWFKKARFSGRNEVSYHEDNFTDLGWNFYMNPMIASLGLLNMAKFYNLDGSKKEMPDITLPYPDLSKFPIYTKK